jgi:hypothetical protein
VHELFGDAARQCSEQGGSKNHETRRRREIRPQIVELEQAERTSLRVGACGDAQGISTSPKLIPDAKLIETFHRVGPEADPGSDLAKLGRLLEDLRVEPGDTQGDHRTEAANAPPKNKDSPDVSHLNLQSTPLAIPRMRLLQVTGQLVFAILQP